MNSTGDRIILTVGSVPHLLQNKDIFPSAPEGTARERVLALDSVEQLIAAAHLHYRRIQASATGLSPSGPNASGPEPDSPVVVGLHVALVADIGALIGTVHRLKAVLKMLPGDKMIRLARKIFERAVSDVEQARNHLEHLDGGIGEIAASGDGAFGTISWWIDLGGGHMACSMYIPGTLAQGAQGITRSPSHMRERIDHVWASVAGRHFDVSDTFWAVCSLEEKLRVWAKSQAEEGWPSLLNAQGQQTKT